MRYLVILCVLLLGACEKTPAPSLQGAEANAPKPVAALEREIAARLEQQTTELNARVEMERRQSERTLRVNGLRSAIQQLQKVRGEISAATGGTMAAPLAALTALRAETAALPIDECTGTARSTLLQSMDKTVAAAARFSKLPGAADEETQKLVRAAQELMFQADNELVPCVNLK